MNSNELLDFIESLVLVVGVLLYLVKRCVLIQQPWYALVSNQSCILLFDCETTPNNIPHIYLKTLLGFFPHCNNHQSDLK